MESLSPGAPGLLSLTQLHALQSHFPQLIFPRELLNPSWKGSLAHPRDPTPDSAGAVATPNPQCMLRPMKPQTPPRGYQKAYHLHYPARKAGQPPRMFSNGLRAGKEATLGLCHLADTTGGSTWVFLSGGREAVRLESVSSQTLKVESDFLQQRRSSLRIKQNLDSS